MTDDLTEWFKEFTEWFTTLTEKQLMYYCMLMIVHRARQRGSMGYLKYKRYCKEILWGFHNDK